MDAVWLTLFFPLLGFAINALVGAWLPKRLCGVIATVAMGAAFIDACVVLAALLGLAADDRHRDLVLYNWVVVDGFVAALGAWVDPLSVLMLLIVTGVGFLIHLYAIGYMADDEGQRRFFAYLNMFVVAMLVLVLADNFMLLLVGWGGVGFASWVLIAHYYYRQDAADAAVKAFVVNTIGDVGMMIGMFLTFLTFGTLQYFTANGREGVFPHVSQAGSGTLTAITLLLLVGAVAKSGQFPLHVWLPDAMAGPTPVSALIHAATMVTAGVYLLVRAWPLYEAAPATLTVITALGILTAFFGATLGVAQLNIKRVLAYSTISQLGYMFVAAGVGAYTAGIFHLLTHAFFKALLFLAAGVVIHAIGGEEDLRQMGGLRRALPLASLSFAIGGLAIGGIPPFSGFFSKDEIIYAAFFSDRGNAFLGIVALITGGLTAFYVFRAYFLAFFGEARYDAGHGDHGHDLHKPGLTMQIPLIILSILATIGGWVIIPNVLHTLETYLEPVFAYPAQYASPVPEASGARYWIVAIVAAILGVIGIWLAYVFYVARPALAAEYAERFAGLRRALLNRYYVDEVYHTAFVQPSRQLGRWLSDGFDRGLERLVNGVGGLVREASLALRDVQTGYVRNYALMILGGAVLIVAYMLFGGM